MIRLSDTKLDHLMDVAETDFERSITAGYTTETLQLYAIRSIAASNLILAELKLREDL
jgi:hypothetical protein